MKKYNDFISEGQNDTMKFRISDVQKENKYKGSYARIFKILDRDRIFTQAYEVDHFFYRR